MKKLMLVAITATLAGCAANDGGTGTYHFSVEDALNSPAAEGIVDPSIKLHFGKSRGQVIKAGVVTNRKTNAVGKTAEVACNWAFLAGVKQLQAAAAQSNANHVSNIISYYKKQPYTSTSQYECEVGNIMVGVALKADLAR